MSLPDVLEREAVEWLQVLGEDWQVQLSMWLLKPSTSVVSAVYDVVNEDYEVPTAVLLLSWDAA
jgi:hypothetical protein